MQPPPGGYQVYPGFRPALQFPGQQQQQPQTDARPAQAAATAANGFAQPGHLQQLGWAGAPQHQQQQLAAAVYQHAAPPVAGRVMLPVVAIPQPSAGMLLQPQYAQPQQQATGQIMRPISYGGIMRPQQMGAIAWPPPTLAPPPESSATGPPPPRHQQHMGGIMRPQRHSQPPPSPSAAGLASAAAAPHLLHPSVVPMVAMVGLAAAPPVLYNPNTGAPIPQLPSAAAAVPSTAPMAVMRNPNTGAPIYPPGHSMMMPQAARRQAAAHVQAAGAGTQAAAAGAQAHAGTTALPPVFAAAATGRASPSRQPAAAPSHRGRMCNGTSAGRGRTLLAPPAKRQRRKDITLPPERLTADPIPRAPQSAAEAAEVEQWVKERKRFFPTAEAVARKDAELEARRDRGELETARNMRQQRLAAVLAQQSAMGLSKAAGTLDMFLDMRRRGGGRGRGRQGFEGGRGGRGSGSYQQQQRGFGWESFVSGGEPSEPSLLSRQQKQFRQPREGGRKRGCADAAVDGGAAVSAGEQAAVQGGTAATGSPSVESAAKRSKAEGDGLEVLGGYGSGSEGMPLLAAGASQQQLYNHHLQQNGGGGWATPASRGGRGGRFGGGGRGEASGRSDSRFGANGGRGRGRGRGGRGVTWKDQEGGRRGGRGGRGGVHNQQQQQQQQRGQQALQQRPPRPLPPTLLQKLLAKEIRLDHSSLLQTFRFFVRNNFLLDWAAGKPLELAPPPAYPPPPLKAQWGWQPGQDGGGREGVVAVVRQGDVQALLASVAKDAIDVELSDEDEGEGLLLPSMAAGAASAGTAVADLDGDSIEGDGEEESEEENSSSEGEREEEEESEAEEGQLLAAVGGGTDALGDALAACANEMGEEKAADPDAGGDEDELEFS